jgi:hypothetical protein
VLFLYTPGRAGKVFEEVLHRPIGSLSQQERVQIRERHSTEDVGPPLFLSRRRGCPSHYRDNASISG